jgi:hypothetical protein
VLGLVANVEGDHASARRHHERSFELKEQLGLEPIVEKHNLGVVALDSGDRNAAIVLFESQLDAGRRADNSGGIGWALLYLGRPPRARGSQGIAARLPQLTAFFTSAAIFASSAAVNSFSAKEVGHMEPSSRFAASSKPNVAYLELNLSALLKKQTTLSSLA